MCRFTAQILQLNSCPLHCLKAWERKHTSWEPFEVVTNLIWEMVRLIAGTYFEASFVCLLSYFFFLAGAHCRSQTWIYFDPDTKMAGWDVHLWSRNSITFYSKDIQVRILLNGHCCQLVLFLILKFRLSMLLLVVVFCVIQCPCMW